MSKINTDTNTLTDGAESYNAEDLWKFVESIAKYKYDMERRIEDSLIRQSGQMQTVFSVTLAAISFVTTLIINNTNILPPRFFFVVLSSIAFLLLLSLVLATFAQKVREGTGLGTMDEIKKAIDSNPEDFATEGQHSRQWSEILQTAIESKSENNKIRAKWVKYSMYAFYGAIALVVLWYIIGISIVAFVD